MKMKARRSRCLRKEKRERERENRKVSICSIPSAIIFPKSDAVARMPELIGFFDFLFSREPVLRKISFLSFSMDLIENKFFFSSPKFGVLEEKYTS
jgi:hypothetical protein